MMMMLMVMVELQKSKRDFVFVSFQVAISRCKILQINAVFWCILCDI